MKLDEYIKKNYRTPNQAVLRSLGANEKLISYLLTRAVVGKAIVGEDKVG